MCNRGGEKWRKGKRNVLVVEFHCDEQQEPSAEGQMHVGRTALSKDMMEVQKLIARTSKQATACLLIQLRDNFTCNRVI